MLFDTGTEGAVFIRNCRNLGLDLGTVEEIAITHGHWDHMGALPAAIDAIVARRGRNAVTVHVNPGMFNERGVLLKSGTIFPAARVPTPPQMEERGAKVVNDGKARLLLDGHFYYSGEIPRVSAFEKGREDHLCRKDNSEEWRPDPYLMDERMLVANVRDLGLVVFSACSHAGIVNVCTETRRLFPDTPIHAVMGGLHLGGVMEHLIPQTVEALKPFDIQSHHRPLHRLAGAACPGRRLWRAGQPVGGRHQLPVRRRGTAGRRVTAATFTAPRRAERVPVTLVTGFLGSGKTTLVNHILSNRAGVKAAVLVNELGDIGIDNDLIVAAEGGMIELSNGCICCSTNNDLLDSIVRVLGRPDPVHHILVETTGVADPLPVAQTFQRPEFRDALRLDAIVAVADAEQFSLDLFDGHAVRSQLRHADAILVNKCDRVGQERLDSVEGKIRAVNAEARLLRTTRSAVPLPLILDVDLHRPASDGHGHHHAHLDETASSRCPSKATGPSRSPVSRTFWTTGRRAVPRQGLPAAGRNRQALPLPPCRRALHLGRGSGCHRHQSPGPDRPTARYRGFAAAPFALPHRLGRGTQ